MFTFIRKAFEFMAPSQSLEMQIVSYPLLGSPVGCLPFHLSSTCQTDWTHEKKPASRLSAEGDISFSTASREAHPKCLPKCVAKSTSLGLVNSSYN